MQYGDAIRILDIGRPDFLIFLTSMPMNISPAPENAEKIEEAFSLILKGVYGNPVSATRSVKLQSWRACMRRFEALRERSWSSSTEQPKRQRQDGWAMCAERDFFSRIPPSRRDGGIAKRSGILCSATITPTLRILRAPLVFGGAPNLYASQVVKSSDRAWCFSTCRSGVILPTPAFSQGTMPTPEHRF